MKKLSLLTAAAVLALGSMIGTAAVAQQSTAKHKVVYHVDYSGGDKDKAYEKALRNAQNHVNDIGSDKIDLRIVLHADGLGMLMNAKENEALKKRIDALKNQHVSFQVCDNTMISRKIDYKKDLYSVAKEDIVPSGVAEIAKLQHQGYAYIKP
jgi:intracellular sulfur oxidation DsrE/DsrF family protein